MRLDKPGEAGSPDDSSRPGDSFSETGLNRVGRDNTPASDHARYHHRMSRDEQLAGAGRGLAGAADAPTSPAPDRNGVPGDRDPGTGNDANRADRRDQGEAGPEDTRTQDPEGANEAGGDGPDDRDTESADARAPHGTEDSGPQLHVRETRPEAALADGDPPRKPPGGNDSHDVRPPGPGHDGVLPSGPRDGDLGESDADRKDAPVRPEKQENSRGDAAAGRETGTPADDEPREQQPDGQPPERDQDAEQGQDRVRPIRDEQRPDDGPDQAGGQNWEAIEQRMQSVVEQRIQAALDEVKDQVKAEVQADNEAKFEAQKAEAESLRSENQELRQKVDDLEARVEGGQSEQRGPVDRESDSEQQPDVSGGEQRADRIQHGVTEVEHGSDDPEISQDQGDALGGYEGTEQKAETKKAELTRWRRLMTSENINAAGTVGGAVNTAAMFATHATPDGMVSLGLTILGLTGLAVSKIEKHRKDKHERPH